MLQAGKCVLCSFQASQITRIALSGFLGQGKTLLHLLILRLLHIFITISNFYLPKKKKKDRGPDMMLITKEKVTNPCLNPVTLCNRRYTWAEESLSTWNLQRMKTTFSERYKTTISSGHLHLKHRNPKILTLCLPHSKILRGAENTVTASKGLTINQESWEKHDKFRSCMRLSAKMQGVAVIHALGRGIFF